MLIASILPGRPQATLSIFKVVSNSQANERNLQKIATTLSKMPGNKEFLKIQGVYIASWWNIKQNKSTPALHGPQEVKWCSLHSIARIFWKFLLLVSFWINQKVFSCWKHWYGYIHIYIKAQCFFDQLLQLYLLKYTLQSSPSTSVSSPSSIYHFVSIKLLLSPPLPFTWGKKHL